MSAAGGCMLCLLTTECGRAHAWPHVTQLRGACLPDSQHRPGRMCADPFSNVWSTRSPQRGRWPSIASRHTGSRAGAELAVVVTSSVVKCLNRGNSKRRRAGIPCELQPTSGRHKACHALRNCRRYPAQAAQRAANENPSTPHHDKRLLLHVAFNQRRGCYLVDGPCGSSGGESTCIKSRWVGPSSQQH